MRYGRSRWLAGVLVALTVRLAVAADFKAGDLVAVKSDRAPIKQGQQVLAWLTKGQRVKLLAVMAGGFALIRFQAPDGSVKEGYVSLRDLQEPVRQAKAAEPAPYSAGDEVIVVAKEARLMMGTKVLGVLSTGTRLTVRKVNQKWLGVNAPVEGKMTWGWVEHTAVDYAPLSTAEEPKPPEPPKPKEPDKAPEPPKEKGTEKAPEPAKEKDKEPEPAK